MTKITIGCDPELFLRHQDTGAFISGHGVLPGNKKEPYKVRNGMVQIDGTALEFGTDPSETCAEFLFKLEDVMDQMQKMAGSKHIISATPVAEYDPDYFKTIPPEALILGCEPDFNAWTMDINHAPDVHNTFRTGSGHVHIGWGEGFDVQGEEHFLTCCALVRQLDYYLGVATLEWDRDTRRREMYGKAGAFRPKPYGLEYRVPSNAWLNSVATKRFVFESTFKGTQDFFNGINKVDKFGTLAQEIIDGNQSDWRSKYDFETGLDYGNLKVA